ncbi:MAG: TPM domain-containing protein [Hyphomicrobiaceae bacterium]
MTTGFKPSPSAWRPPLLAGMAAVVLMLLVTMAEAAGPSFPTLTGRVVDNADLLTGAEEAQLTQALETLEKTSTDQLVVVTLPTLQGYEIEEYGYQLGRHWGIGQKGKDNGVLLIVAPNERKVRIEVGRRLEPILTDGLTKIIIENTILPRFRRGGFGQGIIAGAKDITDALLGDAEEVKQRAGGGLQEDGLDTVAVIFLLIWFAIFFYIVWRAHRSAMRGPQPATTADGRRRRRGTDWVIVPGGWGGSGNWGGGSGGGGWSGGGGGGFGGGGSSGSW